VGRGLMESVMDVVDWSAASVRHTFAKHGVVYGSAVIVIVHDVIGDPMFPLETINVMQGAEVNALVPGWYAAVV